MQHGTPLLVVAGLLWLCAEAHALTNHHPWHAESVPDVLPAVQQEGAVIERIQWGGNACACPAV
jgi:hypothetical protein